MKYLHLIWAALFRRKGRTFLTLVSIITAFLLFGLLDAVRVGFDQAGKSANGAQRLQTGSKLSFIQLLPMMMKKSDSKRTEPASDLIDARIAELGDWRGPMLARLRALIKEADPHRVQQPEQQEGRDDGHQGQEGAPLAPEQRRPDEVEVFHGITSLRQPLRLARPGCPCPDAGCGWPGRRRAGRG